MIILKKEDEENLFIDTWLMSCRVIKRGVENFVLNTLVNFAKINGYRYLIGEYISTAKNQIVKDHFRVHGFQKVDDLWLLELSSYNNIE